MTRTPILTEVVLRAWGTDDPRVVPLLRAENQAGSYRRTKIIGGRAKAAGWPATTMDDAKKAATTAMRRLEGIVYSKTDGHLPRVRAAYHRASRGTDETADGIAVSAVLTIFDE